MTESTKNLFDAPWYVFSSPDDEITVIENESGRVLAELDDAKTANRLARLPELYDALMETVYYKCFECMGGLRHNIDMTREELVKNGCPKQNKSNVCIYVKHIELLQKVRAGK